MPALTYLASDTWFRSARVTMALTYDPRFAKRRSQCPLLGIVATGNGIIRLRRGSDNSRGRFFHSVKLIRQSFPGAMPHLHGFQDRSRCSLGSFATLPAWSALPLLGQEPPNVLLHPAGVVPARLEIRLVRQEREEAYVGLYPFHLEVL